MDYTALYNQYRKLIEDDFIPFWSAYAAVGSEVHVVPGALAMGCIRCQPLMP